MRMTRMTMRMAGTEMRRRRAKEERAKRMAVMMRNGILLRKDCLARVAARIKARAKRRNRILVNHGKQSGLQSRMVS